MLSRTTVLSLVIILSLISPAINAQDDSEALVSDRPFFSQSPNIVPKGTLQLEVGFKASYEKQIEVFNEYYFEYSERKFPELLLRFGAGETMELRLSWSLIKTTTHTNLNTPYSRSINSYISSTNPAGLYVALRLRLIGERNNEPQLSIEPFIIVPSGSLSNELFSVGNKLLFRFPIFGSSFITGSSGVSSNNYNSFQYLLTESMAINFGISHKFSLFIEPILLSKKGTTKFDHSYLLNGGLIFEPVSNIHFDLYVGKGFKSNFDKYYFASIGFSFRPR